MDIVPILFQLLLVFFLIAMNGFFVAAEFACVKIRPSRLETLIQEGSRQAKYAKQLTDHLDASLSVTQLGITLASLGLGWVGEPAVATLILPITHAVGLDDVVGHTISLALAFSIITGMHIVLGELTPKTMAIQNVEKIMLNVALPMLIFHRVMYPFVWLLNHVANWVAHRMGFTRPRRAMTLTPRRKSACSWKRAIARASSTTRRSTSSTTSSTSRTSTSARS